MLTKKTKGVAGLVGVFIGIMVAIIIAVSVVIPTISSTISSQFSTNTSAETLALNNYSSAKILLELSPLLIAVVIVLAIVGIMKMR